MRNYETDALSRPRYDLLARMEWTIGKEKLVNLMEGREGSESESNRGREGGRYAQISPDWKEEGRRNGTKRRTYTKRTTTTRRGPSPLTLSIDLDSNDSRVERRRRGTKKKRREIGD